MIAIAALVWAAAPLEGRQQDLMGPEMEAATEAFADCTKREMPQLDDHKSGAEVIADAVLSACERRVRTLEAAYKKKLIETAQATDALSKRERNKLALELLREMPQQFHEKIEKLVLTAVLRARASQE
jgi:hypothetical protein